MTRRTPLSLLIAGLSLWAAAAPASANWSASGSAAAWTHAPAATYERPELLAQGGCSAAAAQAAAQSGGQVLSVQIADQGGRTVCVVTVLVPARDGSRPRRQTITIPQ